MSSKKWDLLAKSTANAVDLTKSEVTVSRFDGKWRKYIYVLQLEKGRSWPMSGVQLFAALKCITHFCRCVSLFQEKANHTAAETEDLPLLTLSVILLHGCHGLQDCICTWVTPFCLHWRMYYHLIFLLCHIPLSQKTMGSDCRPIVPMHTPAEGIPCLWR